jgi:phospholipid/cholesterol/gamma-HCH transport system substrate-binding protein
VPVNTILERIGERTLGLIGAVATGVAGLVVAAITFFPFGQNHYTAVLEHTAGLRVGEEVQVAGIGFGEVRGIELGDSEVLVDFTLDRDIHLGRSTTAAVKVATLLGTHYLEIVPAGSGDLADDTIPRARTSVPFNLQDVIEGSTGTLNEVDGKVQARSFQVIADALRDTPDDTRSAVEGVARLSAVAAKRSDQMSALLRSSREVTGLLARESDEILDLLRQSTLVLEELTKRRDVIHDMLVDSRRLAKQISGVLEDNEDELEPLLQDFNEALANLRKQEKKVTASITGLAVMAHYFANATGNGPWMDLHVPEGLPDNLICGVEC